MELDRRLFHQQQLPEIHNFKLQRFSTESKSFPKPGVECDDSFFAFYKRRNLKVLMTKLLNIYPKESTSVFCQQEELRFGCK
jgi:hypothetical protein